MAKGTTPAVVRLCEEAQDGRDCCSTGRNIKGLTAFSGSGFPGVEREKSSLQNVGIRW